MGQNFPLGGRTISEFVTLFWIVLAGSTVGFFFDVYRSFRRWNKWGSRRTFVGDIFFSLAALVLLFCFFDKANVLAFRFYMLWGSLLGLFIYLRFISIIVLEILFKFYELIHSVIEGLFYLLRLPYRGLILLMHPLYVILRWAGLLLYRMSEGLLSPQLCRVKEGVIKGLKRFFPPRRNV
ncbi:MAG: spore cortex biosynthesis protein YabQ [Desulfitobacteriaceae bacterium]